MWLNDPQNYTGRSVATGRASHARQIKGDDQKKKGIPWSSSLEVRRVAENPIP